MNQIIYERLKSVACAKGIITYNDIAPLAGLDMKILADRREIGQILEEISSFEYQQGRPMLTVIVIHKGDNLPGKGFFSLARKLGAYRGNNDLQFFANEVNNVYEHWGKVRVKG